MTAVHEVLGQPRLTMPTDNGFNAEAAEGADGRSEDAEDGDLNDPADTGIHCDWLCSRLHEVLRDLSAFSASCVERQWCGGQCALSGASMALPQSRSLSRSLAA
jgi:hypothetical protein